MLNKDFNNTLIQLQTFHESYVEPRILDDMIVVIHVVGEKYLGNSTHTPKQLGRTSSWDVSRLWREVSGFVDRSYIVPYLLGTRCRGRRTVHWHLVHTPKDHLYRHPTKSKSSLCTFTSVRTNTHTHTYTFKLWNKFRLVDDKRSPTFVGSFFSFFLKKQNKYHTVHRKRKRGKGSGWFEGKGYLFEFLDWRMTSWTFAFNFIGLRWFLHQLEKRPIYSTRNWLFSGVSSLGSFLLRTRWRRIKFRKIHEG